MKKEQYSQRIDIRTSKMRKDMLKNKSKELGVSVTELIQNGIDRVLESDTTVRQRTKILVENQERFLKLIWLIDEEATKEKLIKAVEEIMKEEMKLWRV